VTQSHLWENRETGQLGPTALVFQQKDQLDMQCRYNGYIYTSTPRLQNSTHPWTNSRTVWWAPMSAVALIVGTLSSPISTFRLPNRSTIEIWGAFLKSGCKIPFSNSAACSWPSCLARTDSEWYSPRIKQKIACYSTLNYWTREVVGDATWFAKYLLSLETAWDLCHVRQFRGSAAGTWNVGILDISIDTAVLGHKIAC
jgi:hypothetical protein